MARDTNSALALAERALAKRLAACVDVDERGYAPRPEDNLVDSVGPGAWRQARAQLSAGKGDELAQKFGAAYSSSALAVNTFGPLVDHVELPCHGTFDGPIRFEQERSAWAGGYWPTLDVVVETKNAPVRLFVESKCIEFLRVGHPNFSSAFVKHAEQRLSPAAAETYRRLHDDPFAFDPLDARQLAKHFLAAKRAALDSAGSCRVLLLCLTWQPADAELHPVFAQHDEAVRRFSEAVPDEDVEVGALSYRQLWDHWESLREPVLARHAALLRDRYDVHIS